MNTATAKKCAWVFLSLFFPSILLWGSNFCAFFLSPPPPLPPNICIVMTERWFGTLSCSMRPTLLRRPRGASPYVSAARGGLPTRAPDAPVFILVARYARVLFLEANLLSAAQKRPLLVFLSTNNLSHFYFTRACLLPQQQPFFPACLSTDLLTIHEHPFVGRPSFAHAAD